MTTRPELDTEDHIFRSPAVLAMAAGRLGIPDVRVPAWVPADFQMEYLEVAALYGEEAAASHVRKLKREARA